MIWLKAFYKVLMIWDKAICKILMILDKAIYKCPTAKKCYIRPILSIFDDSMKFYEVSL